LQLGEYLRRIRRFGRGGEPSLMLKAMGSILPL
jgi:hypothetical protein